jgi:16S rRNA (guanine966-N2)-methyltransferase
MFSSLESMDAVRGASVVDLFCGSGALGIEALSRGAASATFVDDDPAALTAVRANLTATGLEGDVVGADALRWLEAAERVDLALVDPPYSFDDWDTLFSRVRAGLLVAESDRALELPPGWRTVRLKRYGGTVVHLAANE